MGFQGLEVRLDPLLCDRSLEFSELAQHSEHRVARRCRGMRSEFDTQIRTPRAPASPLRSPTIIAGLRRIATSLWLHFVASPQRVPVFGHRRWGRLGVNLIDRAPPFICYLSIGATSWPRNRIGVRFRGIAVAKPRRHHPHPDHEHRSKNRIACKFRLRQARKSFNVCFLRGIATAMVPTIRLRCPEPQCSAMLGPFDPVTRTARESAAKRDVAVVGEFDLVPRF